MEDEERGVQGSWGVGKETGGDGLVGLGYVDLRSVDLYIRVAFQVVQLGLSVTSDRDSSLPKRLLPPYFHRS